MKERIRSLITSAIVSGVPVYLTSIQTSCAADESRSATPTPASASARSAIDLNRISFYKVPLVCPAAPQIGCGSASKPLLLELEHSSLVSEAWLNRAGTMMAVVWSEQSKPRQRVRTLKAILKRREMTAKELIRDARQQAAGDFQSGGDWFRGADVDHLSEEEAGVIANRWIGRFREKIVLTDEKSKTLQEEFTTQIKRQLTGQTTREATREEMLNIARHYLDEKDVAVLLEAFGNGFRPKTGD